MFDKNTNKIIESLTRNLSHEVKNPLTTIKGYAQLIELKSNDEFALKAVSIMNEQIEAIENQFNEIYSVFQKKHGTDTEFDLVSLVSASVEGVSANLDIEFASEVFENRITCDQEMLVRMLDIFFTGINFEYFNDISIKVCCGNDNLKIIYNNVSIPEEEMEMLFLPYSSKTLFKQGTAFYELYYICMTENFDITIEKFPSLSFIIKF
ncbi:MAG TPA: histidine kinase dimerization/phospho-acceptor domain-containing protein [Spirochaetota bacterium]|nr:histidine kinase dimerization/phospho-acceptor domain-containing protein [Spirochaetota bacterium]